MFNIKYSGIRIDNGDQITGNMFYLNEQDKFRYFICPNILGSAYYGGNTGYAFCGFLEVFPNSLMQIDLGLIGKLYDEGVLDNGELEQ